MTKNIVKKNSVDEKSLENFHSKYLAAIISTIGIEKFREILNESISTNSKDSSCSLEEIKSKLTDICSRLADICSRLEGDNND